MGEKPKKNIEYTATVTCTSSDPNVTRLQEQLKRAEAEKRKAQADVVRLLLELERTRNE